MEEDQQEGFDLEPQKRAKQQEVLSILNTIVRRAHCVHGMISSTWYQKILLSCIKL